MGKGGDGRELAPTLKRESSLRQRLHKLTRTSSFDGIKSDLIVLTNIWCGEG